jgi:hypothetical protein
LYLWDFRSLPTDVQDETIPLILGGGDVMVASETGSGKTGAFCLPMIQCVHERLREPSQSKRKVHRGPFQVRLSEDDKDNLLLIGVDGLSCECPSQKQWTGCRATHGVRYVYFVNHIHLQYMVVEVVNITLNAQYEEVGSREWDGHLNLLL